MLRRSKDTVAAPLIPWSLRDSTLQIAITSQALECLPNPHGIRLVDEICDELLLCRLRARNS